MFLIATTRSVGEMLKLIVEDVSKLTVKLGVGAALPRDVFRSGNNVLSRQTGVGPLAWCKVNWKCPQLMNLLHSIFNIGVGSGATKHNVASTRSRQTWYDV